MVVKLSTVLPLCLGVLKISLLSNQNVSHTVHRALDTCRSKMFRKLQTHSSNSPGSYSCVIICTRSVVSVPLRGRTEAR